MSGFVFRNRIMKISIAGNNFEIEVSLDVENLMKRISNEAVDVVKQYQADRKTAQEVIAIYKGYFAEILGDSKAPDKIFKGRMADVRDCMDVLTYIATEIATFNRLSAF